MKEKTSWPRVAALYLAAICVAFQYGKVPGALPVLRAELDLSLVTSGWLVSTLNLITAVLGAIFGAMADRIGYLRAVSLGMLLTALASLMGGFAQSAGVLLLARGFEGFGLAFTIVAVAPLILAQCAPHDRQKALGFYGAYMPGGMGVMLLAAGPLIAMTGWRGLWFANAGLLIVVLLIVRFALKGAIPVADAVSAEKRKPQNPFVGLLDVMSRPGPWLLAICFGVYAGHYLVIMSFLPLIFVEQDGFSLTQATTFGALAVTINVTGSVMSGFLLARGVPRVGLIVFASVVMGATALGIFWVELPFAVRFGLILIQSTVVGLIPGSLWAGAPLHAPTPAQAASVNGLMQQGSSLGNLLGPPAAGFFVSQSGSWYAASIMVFVLAIICAVSGLMLGRVEKKLTHGA